MDSDEKLEEAVLSGCALVVLGLAHLAGIVGRGLALSLLWGWFVTPIFGLPALTLAGACGLILVFAALRGYKQGAETDKDAQPDDTKAATKLLVVVVLQPSLLIGLGWIVKSLI